MQEKQEQQQHPPASICNKTGAKCTEPQCKYHTLLTLIFPAQFHANHVIGRSHWLTGEWVHYQLTHMELLSTCYVPENPWLASFHTTSRGQALVRVNGLGSILLLHYILITPDTQNSGVKNSSCRLYTI